MTLIRILTAIRRPSDTKTLSESVEGTFIEGNVTYTREISDTVDIFENIYGARVVPRTVDTDTTTLTESVSRSQSLIRQRLDVIELIDNILITTRPIILILLSETVPVVELLNESELLIRRPETEDVDVLGSAPPSTLYTREATEPSTITVFDSPITRYIIFRRLIDAETTPTEDVHSVLYFSTRIIIPFETTPVIEQAVRRLKLIRQKEEFE